MKSRKHPELAQAINRQAHLLAAQSFPSIRMTLEERARAMLKEGYDLEATLRAIRTAGLQSETPDS